MSVLLADPYLTHMCAEGYSSRSHNVLNVNLLYTATPIDLTFPRRPARIFFIQQHHQTMKYRRATRPNHYRRREQARMRYFARYDFYYQLL